MMPKVTQIFIYNVAKGSSFKIFLFSKAAPRAESMLQKAKAEDKYYRPFVLPFVQTYTIILGSGSGSCHFSDHFKHVFR
jgi:hypothetical protein